MTFSGLRCCQLTELSLSTGLDSELLIEPKLVLLIAFFLAKGRPLTSELSGLSLCDFVDCYNHSLLYFLYSILSERNVLAISWHDCDSHADIFY